MTKKLKTALDAAIMGYVKAFEKKHDVYFEWAASDDLTGWLNFGDHYFSIADVIYDVDNKLPIMLIFEWHDACIEYTCQGNKQIINLRSYSKGLRYE